MSKKKTEPEKRSDEQRVPQPPQKRRRESAPSREKRKQFSDTSYVQQPLFDLDQGDSE